MKTGIFKYGNSAGRRDGKISLRFILLINALAAVVMGFGIAMFTARSGDAAPTERESAQESRAQKEHVFVTFGTVVVNLKGERLTRLLQATIILQVRAGDGRGLESLLEDRKVLFQDWLITHLADKTIEDVEGSASMRKLKREIEDGLNSILASLGASFGIEAVLFEEFNVQ